MSTIATEPTIFSTLSPDSLIRFKYSGGSTPGNVRTVRVVSWFWAWGEQQGQGEGYLQAYDSYGVFKTYHYSKMSLIYVCSTPEKESEPEPEPEPEPENVNHNDLSKWTSWIKKGDILEFTYKNQTQIRNVTFVNFMDRRCSIKRKIMCYENEYAKKFFINEMTIHKIYETLENQDDEDITPTAIVLHNEDNTPTAIVLHNEVIHLEKKQNLLIKEMKAHIDSQNIMIEKLKKKMFILEEDCVHLEKEKQNAYITMKIHKRRYPATWELSNFVPKLEMGMGSR